MIADTPTTLLGMYRESDPPERPTSEFARAVLLKLSAQRANLRDQQQELREALAVNRRCTAFWQEQLSWALRVRNEAARTTIECTDEDRWEAEG